MLFVDVEVALVFPNGTGAFEDISGYADASDFDDEAGPLFLIPPNGFGAVEAIGG